MRRINFLSRRDFGKAAAVGLAGLSNVWMIPNSSSAWPVVQGAPSKNDERNAGQPEPFVDWYEVWPGATAYEKNGWAWVVKRLKG